MAHLASEVPSAPGLPDPPRLIYRRGRRGGEGGGGGGEGGRGGGEGGRRGGEGEGGGGVGKFSRSEVFSIAKFLLNSSSAT